MGLIGSTCHVRIWSDMAWPSVTRSPIGPMFCDVVLIATFHFGGKVGYMAHHVLDFRSLLKVMF